MPLRELERDLDYPFEAPAIAGSFPLVDGYATARDRATSRWGLVDAAGDWIVPPTFRNAGVFCGGLFAVGHPTARTVGFADPRGQVVIAEDHVEVDVFSEGLCAARQGKTWGFLDASGAWVIAPRFQRALAFHDGLAPVRVGTRWGYVDRAGAIAIEPRFDRAFCFEHDRAQVVVDGRAPRGRLADHADAPLRELRGTWGVIDRAGAWLVTPRFEYAESQFGGIGTQADERLGVGSVFAVVTPRLEGCARFREGLAAVRVDGRWGYADADGRIVIPPQYAWAGPFANGVARVGRDGGEVVEITARA